MRETWRWFGEFDEISLDKIAQTGAQGIVSSLHDIAYGKVWPRHAIAARRNEIEAQGFTWDVVESLPIHEDIKRGVGDLDGLFENYRQSLVNLAAEGINTICYNFMPVLDWTRTDLEAPVKRGGTCLRFSAPLMAAFEIHLIGREQARNHYSAAAVKAGDEWYQNATAEDHNQLLHAIMSGLPGAFDRYDISGLQTAIAAYAGMTHADIRNNLARFLKEVIPTASKLGINMCIHPDDPPMDILGLPRIVSNKEDIAWILNAVDDPANGLTLCSGSLGAGKDNDVVDIAKSFAGRIHFAHLRNVSRDPDGSFEESAHLEGDVDLVAVTSALIALERARGINLPFRADHGHSILFDMDQPYQPGYTLIGRLRSLAELRGVIKAIS